MYKIENISISRNDLLNLSIAINSISLITTNKYFINLLQLNIETFNLINNILQYKEKMLYISKEYEKELIMFKNEYADKDEQGTIISFNEQNAEYLNKLTELNIKYKKDYQEMLNRKEILNIWLKTTINIKIVKMQFEYFPDSYIPAIVFKYLALDI